MRVKDILVFYYLSFKGIFVFFGGLWRCRTRVLGWRKNSSFSKPKETSWTSKNWVQ